VESNRNLDPNPDDHFPVRAGEAPTEVIVGELGI